MKSTEKKKYKISTDLPADVYLDTHLQEQIKARKLSKVLNLLIQIYIDDIDFQKRIDSEIDYLAKLKKFHISEAELESLAKYKLSQEASTYEPKESAQAMPVQNVVTNSYHSDTIQHPYHSEQSSGIPSQQEASKQKVNKNQKEADSVYLGEVLEEDGEDAGDDFDNLFNSLNF
jgi:hypothetical protein